MCMYSSTRLYETFLTGHKGEVVTLGWWIHSIHLCLGISGASVDRAAAVLGAGARETRIWHCSWTTGATLHRKFEELG